MFSQQLSVKRQCETFNPEALVSYDNSKLFQIIHESKFDFVDALKS